MTVDDLKKRRTYAVVDDFLEMSNKSNMENPPIVDEPQNGFYAIRGDDGREIPGWIDWHEARLDGEPVCALNIWHGKGRRKITETEYRRLRNRPTPTPPNIDLLSHLVATANSWELEEIKTEIQAEHIRDLRVLLRQIRGQLIESRANALEPLERQVDAVKNWYNPLIKQIKNADAILQAKLTTYLQHQRNAAICEQAAEALLSSAIDEDGDALVPVIESPAPIKIRGNQPGRAMSLRRRTYAVVDDWDLACETFRNDPSVIETLNKLGSSLVRAQHKQVTELPGFRIITEEKAQ